MPLPEQIEQIRWMARVRWVLAAGLPLAALLVSSSVHYNIVSILLIGTVIAGYNSLALLYARTFETRGKPLLWPGELSFVLNFQVALDLFLLSVAVHLTGGVESLLLPAYLVYLPTVGLLLPRRATFAQATFALLLLGLVFWLEFSGYLAHAHFHPLSEASLHANVSHITRVLILQSGFLYFGALVASFFRSQFRTQQRQLIQLRNFSDSIIESIGQGVLVLDLEARVVRFNRFLREQYGWDEKKELGCNVFEQRPDLRKYGLEARFREIIEQGKALQFRDLHRVTRQGKEVYQNLYGYPLYRDGEIVGAVILIEDVTEQRQAQVELQRLLEEMRRRNEELAARNAIARAVTRSLDLNEILEELHREIQRFLAPDTFSVVLYDPKQEMLDVCFVVEEGKRLPSMKLPFDERGGLTAWVIRERKSLLVRDVEADQLPVQPRHITRPARSWLGIPLIARNQVVGALSVQSFRPAAFDEADRDFLTAVADHVAIAIENARLLEAERRTRQQAETLQRVTAALSSTLELDQLLNLMLEYLEQLVAYDSASVMLVEGETARVVAARGFPDKSRALQVQVTLSEDPAFQEVVERRAPLLLRDAARDPRFRGLGGTDYVRSWICAPLIARGAVVGLLTVDNREPGAYNAQDAALVQAFASNAALAVENAQLYEKMRHMAVTDGLTGLYNSRHFYRVLEEELQRSKRYDRPFSLLMFDLDDFKKYNDRYGHLAGDDLLRELAGLVRTITRGSDLAFRYGGEEFTLILPETPRPAALKMAERLRATVQDHEFVVRGGTDVGRITISIGVATCPDDGQDAESLVYAADMALLEAKKYKNRVCTVPSRAMS